MNKAVFSSSLALATAALFVSGVASAQEVSGQAGMALPGAAPPAAAAVSGDSDHDMMIGTLAVGYLGMSGMHLGNGGAATGEVDVRAPVIGVRYWMDEMLGIDAGLGFHSSGETTEVTGAPDADGNAPTVFILHGGVPLSLLSESHYSFQIVPEMNLGFGSNTLDPPGAGDIKNSGFHLDLGARAGAEVHFGFIGIPRLSLQGSVGLRFVMESGETEVSGAGATNTTKYSRNAIETTVGSSPWEIFTGGVSALYYF